MADHGTHVVLAMTEHLTDVEALTPEQEARARDLSSQMNDSYVGNYSAARVIIQLQDEVARLERDRTFVALMGSTPTADCPVTFEKGELGACSACGKTFECGAKVALQPAVQACPGHEFKCVHCKATPVEVDAETTGAAPK